LLQGKTINTLLNLTLIRMLGGGMGVVGGGMAMASVTNGGSRFSWSSYCTPLCHFLGTLKLLGG